MLRNTNEKVRVLIYEDYLPYLEGKVLTIVETLGLKEKQEESIKSLIRESFWQNLSLWAYYVPVDEFRKISDNNENVKKMYLELPQGEETVK